MLKIYELALLTSGNLNEAAAKAVFVNAEKILKEQEVKVLDTLDWGRKKLAYKIKGSDFGYYKFYRIEIDSQDAAKVTNLIRLNPELLRTMIFDAASLPDFKQEPAKLTETLEAEQEQIEEKTEKKKTPAKKASKTSKKEKAQEIVEEENQEEQAQEIEETKEQGEPEEVPEKIKEEEPVEEKIEEDDSKSLAKEAKEKMKLSEEEEEKKRMGELEKKLGEILKED